MLRLRFGCGLAALMVGGGLGAAPAPLAEDARMFGVREAAGQVALSPSGNKVVMLVAGTGSSSVAKVFDLVSGASTTVLMSRGNPESLGWCKFASETQLICQYGGNVPIENQIVGFSRLVTLRIDGKNLKPLGQRRSFYDAGLRQFDGSILDWLVADNGAVLMERNYVPEQGRTGSMIVRNKQGLGVDRVELATMKSSAVELPNNSVSGYITDGRGAVRIRSIDEADGTERLTGITRYSYRVPGSRDWRDLGKFDSRDGSGLYPLAVEADSNSLFMLKKVDGRDALYRMPLDGSGAATLVAKNPSVDIDGVTRIGRGQRVIGYTYADESRHTVYFDPEFQKLSMSLGRALPKLPIVDFAGASADGSKVLVFAGSDTSSGTYYLLDRKTNEMGSLADVRPALAQKTLSPVKAIRYTARDGTSIPAYLTVPAGSGGKGLPAVVLPHGGPSSRDEWGFNWLAQFLAARGYAVIQPNYRGSAGYGDEFLNVNGFRNWKASISDVTDAARYLVKVGIADDKRLAIVGWSYGGYAALQSAAIEPDMFKAVVAIAPVSDLALLKRESDGFTNSDLVKEFVGSGDQVNAGSPLRNAAAIKAPVLLVHGDLDANVGIAHSQKMQSTLASLGKPVEMLSYKGLEHQLADSNARVEMLTKIGALLDRTIGK